MKQRSRTSSLLLILLGLVFSCGFASAGTIVIVQSGNRYEFLSGDQLQINGKDRVRVGTLAASYTSKQIGQFSTQKINQISLIQFDLKLKALVIPPGESSIVLPDADKAEGTAEQLWTRAVVCLTKAGSKQCLTMPPGQIMAILQGGAVEEQVAKFLSNESNFKHPGGSSEGLKMQGEMIAGGLAAFPGVPALQSIRISSEKALSSSIEKLDSGAAEVADLAEARQRAKMSALVFPADAAQAALRAKLDAKEKQLAEAQAVLKAFEAASLWDPYVAKYRDMQRYEFMFPEFQDGFLKALASSRDEHKRLASERQLVRDCAAALSHYRIALKRDPADVLAREQAETARVCLIRTPRIARASRKAQSVAEMAPAGRSNEFVMRFLQENKLESAEKELKQGLRLYPDNPKLVLSQARMMERRNELRAALTALDRYDSLVSTQAEWDEGDRARRDVEFQILKTREERGKRLIALIAENRFGSAMAEVQEGLSADNDDQDLLFRAGVLQMMLRQPAAAKTTLLRYLEASQSLAGTPARRKQALQLLTSMNGAVLDAGAGEKKANWLSGNMIPVTLFYDPASLAFHRKLDRVEMSQKQAVEFQWVAEKLEGVQMVGEGNPARVMGKIRFEYNTAIGAVGRVHEVTGAAPAPVSATRSIVPVRGQASNARANLLLDEASAPTAVAGGASTTKLAGDIVDQFAAAGLPVLLSNNPQVDVAAIERLTGAQVAYTVAGNKYFNPFVWDKPYHFRLSYDEQRRAIRAYPVTAGAEVAEVYVFGWDGMRLTEISIHPALAGLQPDLSKTLYRRVLSYSDNNLTMEKTEMQGGKPTRIEYKYEKGALASIEGEADASTGNRSFKVKFNAR